MLDVTCHTVVRHSLSLYLMYALCVIQYVYNVYSYTVFMVSEECVWEPEYVALRMNLSWC